MGKLLFPEFPHSSDLGIKDLSNNPLIYRALGCPISQASENFPERRSCCLHVFPGLPHRV